MMLHDFFFTPANVNSSIKTMKENFPMIFAFFTVVWRRSECYRSTVTCPLTLLHLNIMPGKFVNRLAGGKMFQWKFLSTVEITFSTWSTYNWVVQRKVLIRDEMPIFCYFMLFFTLKSLNYPNEKPLTWLKLPQTNKTNRSQRETKLNLAHLVIILEDDSILWSSLVRIGDVH